MPRARANVVARALGLAGSGPSVSGVRAHAHASLASPTHAPHGAGAALRLLPARASQWQLQALVLLLVILVLALNVTLVWPSRTHTHNARHHQSQPVQLPTSGIFHQQVHDQEERILPRLRHGAGMRNGGVAVGAPQELATAPPLQGHERGQQTVPVPDTAHRKLPDPATKGLEEPLFPNLTPVLLICYNRPDYLKRTLESLKSRILALPQASRRNLPVVVSQDGNVASVDAVVKAFAADMQTHNAQVHHKHHPRDNNDRSTSYHKLSKHYVWALHQAFDVRDASGMQPEQIIILEDDLELAVDFFPFVAAMRPILARDESLLAVSAWNDHGQADFVAGASPDQFFRSDFFPGLGWMLPRRVWIELEPIWPDAYWDDWLRSPEHRKDRQVIRPEISRTITFGAQGASVGQYFKQYLQPMRLNDQPADFSRIGAELALLADGSEYHRHFLVTVQKATEVRTLQDLLSAAGRGGYDEGLRISYEQNGGFETLARRIGLMPDIKFNVIRGSYAGILPVRVKGTRVFLVP